ncbi:MAG TPA: TonB-dependent receptor [Burkholderiales bacterium]|jgi:iron complex outermembrane receptor protein|nr:TonB-dependent receptor [Burkholderiales bacterium]
MKVQLLAFAAGITAVFPVLAQQPWELTTEDIVVTTTRFEDHVSEQPIAVQVITAQQVRNSGVRTLPELLSRQAGIYSRDNTGSPNQQIDMRGFGIFGDQNTLILVDGQRISENEQIPADLASIPLSSIERIEILRGSGAVLYGGGATGGTINIITRGASPNAKEGEVRAGYGTYNTSDFAAGVRLGGEKVGVAVNANQYDSDNYRDNNEIRQRNVQTDFRYFGENGPVYLKLGAGDQDLRLPGSRTEAQLASNRRGTANPNDFGTLRSTRATLGTSQVLSIGEVAADLSYRERDSFALNDPGTSDISGRVTSFSPRMKIPISFAGNHVLVAGLDWDQWDYSFVGFFPGFPSATRSDQENTAVFIKDTVELGSTTRLSLGGRIQRTDTSITDVAGGTPTVTQIRRPEAWEFALRQDLGGAVSVYGKTGQSFRIANVDDNRGLTTPLEPQVSRDAEAGGEYRGEGVRLRAAVYRMNINNEILFLPSDVLPPFGANVNLPPTRRAGVELEAGWDASAWLILSANYSYTTAKFRGGNFGGADVTDKNIPLVPRNRAGVAATVIPVERVRVTAIVSYVGEQYYDNDQSNSFGRKMPEYTVVDLAASLDRGNWRLSASVRNLMNEHYYSYAIRSVTAPTFNAYPAPERSLFFTAEYRFGR